MKSFFIKALGIISIALTPCIVSAQKQDIATSKGAPKVPFECSVQPYYKFRTDKKAGRSVILHFGDTQLTGKAIVKVECNGVTEETVFNDLKNASELSILLPAGAGLSGDCQARITVTSSQANYYKAIMVPAMREWTIYIYPHSHVDIGYTNTQEFVRQLHMRNIDVAIDIAKKTQNYPEGSRFVWNPEAIWVTQNYLKEATPEKKQKFIEGVRKGWISLDGDFGNINTSACTDEELLRLFHDSKAIQQTTGVPIKTMVQMDVAGSSWGITQTAFQNGIHAFIDFPNIGAIRQPWEHRPFYWVSPDGKSKILYLQALPYGYGWEIKGTKQGLFKTQGNDPKLRYMSTANPSANFINPVILRELSMLEARHSAYNIAVLPWALADNSLIDADLPDAVRTWNENYAWPKLIIAGSQKIINDFEHRFGSIIPQIKGDYTEYWTDGLGSDAKRIGLYRQANENIVQAETLWSMLNPKAPSPRKLIDSAWENCLLGAEHTWGYQDPKAPLANQIEATKAGYFENAYTGSQDLIKAAFKSIEKPQSNKIAVFNTLSWARSGLVTLSREQSVTGERVTDKLGHEVPSQRLSTGELVFMADNIPALGSATFTIVKGDASNFKGCSINRNTISNGILSVTIDPNSGDIVNLINEKNKQEYVDQKSPHHINSYYYSLSQDTSNKAFSPTDVVLKIKENGPLVSSIIVESKAEGCKWLNREVKLIYNQPWIDLTNTFDKISTRTKEDINFGFAFNIPNPTTRIDIPWGLMIPEYDQIDGANKNWLTMQRWVDVSNTQTGVTWTAIEAPLIELGGMTANHQSGGAYGSKNWYKTMEQTQPLFSWVLNNHWGTNFTLEQGGIMSFHYGIRPHGSYDASLANRFGMEQNRPLLAVAVDKEPAITMPVKIGNPMVFLSNLKESDDGKGWVLRVRSISDKPEKVLITWPQDKASSIYQCLANEVLGNKVSSDLTILPYGTLSYYIKK
ncbi:MAG: glycoside hydrolase family 38 C-terminal domain-containing protein [Mucilaginibacter sp.]|uniref:glycoside hydrolase family 38 N-terminal domain-containing protein n=1 Tax=Mucilaginibacter sp. TaxID=1882438 RepID=UPI0031A6643B